MTNIGDKIKSARKELKMKQSELAEIIGVSNTTISGWENGASRPDVDMLELLCGALRVSADYFFERIQPATPVLPIQELELLKKYRSLTSGSQRAVEGIIDVLFYAEQNRNTDNIIDINIRRLPLYDVPVSAGTGNFLDDSPFEIMEVGADAPIQTSYLLRASGDSMEPKIYDGDTLYIKQQSFVEDGEIGIFWYDGQVYVKKFERHGNSAYLVSLNPKYAPIKVNGDPIRCYGKVLNK